MKVLFLTNIPSPYRVDFFNELGKYCDLTVAFEGKHATDRNPKWQFQKESNYTSVFLRGVRTGSDKFLCLGVTTLITKGWNHIIVGVYSTPTGMIAIEYMKIKKIKFFIEADGGMINNDNFIKYRIKKYFISSANAWFSSGKVTTKYLAYYGAKESRCYVYPFTSLRKIDLDNALSTCMVDKKIIRGKIGMTEKYIVLTVGRFNYKDGYGKGYDTVMKAAEHLPKDIGFYIVGDNPTEEFINWKRVKKLDNIHFVGFKTKEELAHYYATADVFVLMTRADVWGLVINEALSFGLPVITTDKCVAGLELIENGKNGFIVPTEDTAALEEKISYLCNNYECVEIMRINNIKLSENYTIENMAKVHMEILNKYSC